MPSRGRVRKTARRELSAYQRGTITGLQQAGTSWKKIAELTGVSKSTVQYTVEQEKNRPEGESLPRAPKAKKTTSDQDKAIVASVQQDPWQSYQTLQKNLAPEVSSRTIRRRLAENDGLQQSAHY